MPNFKQSIFIIFFTFSFAAVAGVALAEEDVGQPSSVQEAGFKSRCQKGNCANSPTECKSDEEGKLPINCIYLLEPIGGRTGYDLFKIVCSEDPKAKTNQEREKCEYILWYGEAIITREGQAGPVQAILAYEPGKETQGPFGLLYNYLGLVYNYLSGVIIAFVVLMSVVGGIRMSASGGNQESFSSGRSMIIKAMIGMILWFTASVILYTINPTFFAF